MNCGTFIFIKSCLCQHCYKALISRFSQTHMQMPLNKKTLSLLNWNPGESDILSKFILKLKCNEQQMWNQLSFDFIQKHKINYEENRVLVSLHSTSPNRTHAQDWGFGLSQYLGCEHHTILKKVTKEVQKKKTKNERSQLLLLPIVDISYLKHKKVIFVDDVVTTGATLKAAYEALGEPKKFECWAMVTRTATSIADFCR